jgi:hypothetical protein
MSNCYCKCVHYIVYFDTIPIIVHNLYVIVTYLFREFKFIPIYFQKSSQGLLLILLRDSDAGRALTTPQNGVKHQTNTLVSAVLQISAGDHMNRSKHHGKSTNLCRERESAQVHWRLLRQRRARRSEKYYSSWLVAQQVEETALFLTCKMGSSLTKKSHHVMGGRCHDKGVDQLSQDWKRWTRAGVRAICKFADVLVVLAFFVEPVAISIPVAMEGRRYPRWL